MEIFIDPVGNKVKYLAFAMLGIFSSLYNKKQYYQHNIDMYILMIKQSSPILYS